jgi:RNA ligase
MKLGDLLDVAELRRLIDSRHIIVRRHPTLPLAILNYSNECMFDNFWPEEVQICRGLIIDLMSGHEPCPDCNVVSRPFHKFFNLNQTDQPTTHENVLASLGVEPTVTEKMDGWFGIQWRCEYEGQVHYGIASRGSFESSGALFATGKLPKLIKYGAVDEFPKGYTPIFEIICKETKVVVEYPFEGLVLLALVNNETGEELPYDELQAIWAKIAGYSADNRPWIRLVKSHRMSVGEAISSPKTNFEGYVLSYPRAGTWPIKVKVKLDDYKRLHKLITGVTPQQIWGTLHDPIAPWYRSNVPAHFRTWVTDWRNTLMGLFHERLAEAVILADAWLESTEFSEVSHDDHIDSKPLALNYLQKKNPDLAGVALQLLDGNIYAAYQTIWKRVRPVGNESEVFYREGDKE